MRLKKLQNSSSNSSEAKSNSNRYFGDNTHLVEIHDGIYAALTKKSLFVKNLIRKRISLKNADDIKYISNNISKLSSIQLEEMKNILGKYAYENADRIQFIQWILPNKMFTKLLIFIKQICEGNGDLITNINQDDRFSKIAEQNRNTEF